MTEKTRIGQVKVTHSHLQRTRTREKAHTHSPAGSQANDLKTLQHTIGNQILQRALARPGEGSAWELDERTTSRIDQERGSGQLLSAQVQTKMEKTFGQDFSGVRVHTSEEAGQLSEELDAKAFTTGRDIFFRPDAYHPDTAEGQSVIAHELTHVLQQRHGLPGGSPGKMTVNPPGDIFEKQAEQTTNEAVGTSPLPGLQRQVEDDEEEVQTLQRQEERREDEEEQL